MNAARSVSSASRPCSSLAGRNAAHCKLNLCKTFRIRGAVGKGWEVWRESGGQNLKPPVKPDHRHPPALSRGTLGNSDKGAKLFVPPVRGVYFTNQLSTGAVKTFDPAGF